MTDWKRETDAVRCRVQWEGERVCVGIGALCDESGALVVPKGETVKDAVCRVAALHPALYDLGLQQCLKAGMPELSENRRLPERSAAQPEPALSEPPGPDPEAEREAELETMTKEQLRSVARDLSIEGRSTMSKAALIEAILEAEDE